MRCRGLVIAVAAVALAASSAAANGRFPATASIDFQPGHPEVIAAGVTFGLLVSRDDGATWRWYCESAIGFEGTYDPDYKWTRSGALFASTFNGLEVLRDTCAWQPVAGPLGTTNISSMNVGPDDAIWVGTADPVNGSAVFRSTDDGQTFAMTSLVGMPGDVWSSIAPAPSDGRRVYISSTRMTGGNPRERLLFRTADAGATWDSLPTTAFVGTNSSELVLAAVHPTDPDQAYVIVTNISTGLRSALYRTADFSTALPAGPTWTKVLESATRIAAVVVRANGDVLAATPAMGLYRSTDGGLTFAEIPDVRLDSRCLRERVDGTLWMCTNNLPPDGAALHVTTDPTSWTRKLTFAELTGPARCPAGTRQHDDCEALLWCGVRENLGITSTEIDCSPPVDAGIDASGGGGGGKSCCAIGRGPGLEIGVVALGLLVRRRRRHGARVAR